MDETGIAGPHASPNGLGHGFAIEVAQKTCHPRVRQGWLGLGT